jgi:hypothetical protein
MPLYVKTGTYTGTGSGTIPVDVGFAPKAMMIYGPAQGTATTFVPRIKTDTMSANDSGPLTNIGYYTDGNLTFSGNTFVGAGIGTNGFNISGKVYYYIVLGGSSCVTGSYAGNATDNRSITGLGIDPDLVIIRNTSGSAVASNFKTTAHGKLVDLATPFSTSASAASLIQQLITDGFQVGTGSGVNASTFTHHYVAIQKSGNTAYFNEGTYTGNSADNTNITGIGFDPTFVFLKGASSGYPVRARSVEVGDTSGAISAGNTAANNIQSFITDGFQIGNAANVNQSGITFYWVAFKDNAPSASATNSAMMMHMMIAGGIT